MSSKEKKRTKDIPQDNNCETNKSINIRIRGLGNDITVSSIDPSMMKLSDLQEMIELRTGLPSPYQRIICNGKTLTSTTTTRNCISNSKASISEGRTEEEKDDLTLAQLGIKCIGGTTTKVILMHSSAFAQDQDIITVIMKLSNELELLEMQSVTFEKEQIAEKEDNVHKMKEDEEKSKKYILQIHHQLTTICCKLDEIDVTSSASLRIARKRILERADVLEEKINKLKLFKCSK